MRRVATYDIVVTVRDQNLDITNADKVIWDSFDLLDLFKNIAQLFHQRFSLISSLIILLNKVLYDKMC